MFAQIISHTPLWVWALLAFLIYRGVLASVDRELTLKKLSIIPLVMLALSWQGVSTVFGVTPLPMLCWLLAAALAAALNWRLFRTDSVIAYPERGVLLQRGSWLPLMLMMGVFLTKYTVGVTLATHPALAHDAVFTALVCALYGVFNGMFIGRLLRVVSLYHSAKQIQAAPAAYNGQLNG
ncbi:hypothetical protein SAMN04515617_107133 [Collimonas sp. OK242]|jgi:hypothetical protein|uniref:DUF6622 family protein n=1 Tax=Collimonas sp. OK242 TaxID=1798195 RepID=UPI0008957D5D|nr:DUF6622 family protein [Collimonas sp. OK242]SDX83578.1 hypothetical protein SAMN04515617_107133 [Collimonas sp. OK242]